MRSELIKQAKRYFRQQAELFGEEVWLPETMGNSETASPAVPGHPADYDYPYLDTFYEAVKDCQRCPLGKTRTNLVFGAGNPHSKLVFVGEAPGRDEDLQGIPFVGRAGQLLTKILRAIELERDDIYICNILKCRPPNNRDPMEEEVVQCEPYLLKQLKIIDPKIIVALGRVAAQNLLKTKVSLKEMRGKKLYYKGIRMVVTYHPAAILRNRNLKRPTWDDFQFIQKLIREI